MKWMLCRFNGGKEEKKNDKKKPRDLGVILPLAYVLNGVHDAFLVFIKKAPNREIKAKN